MQTTAPDRVGRYRLEQVLGSGGMAVVYLGSDDELRRPVAVKLLADNLAVDDEFRARFMREARLAAGLAHPNVVQVYDLGEADGRPYIVMEYVDGGTVADLGRVDADEALRLIAQVCSGLAHAHAAGLVHRDIKPGNLLVSRDGVVKIADFGIARAADVTRLTAVGSVLGTASYLAPEQGAGEEVGPPADVYATGVVLYQLLSGRLPYPGTTPVEVLTRQRTAAPPPIRDVSPAVEQLVMRCLAQAPEYRPSAAEAAETISMLSGEPPTQLLVPAPRRSRRRLAAALVVAVALLAALAVALVIADRSSSPAGTPVERTPALSPDPAQQARDLAAWLRLHAQR